MSLRPTTTITKVSVTKFMKIAFICAYIPSNNPGQIQVELAISHFARYLAVDTEITRFTLQSSMHYESVEGFSEDIFLHELTSPDQLIHFDQIVYWGDFLHWKQYEEIDLVNRNILLEKGLSRDQVRDFWYRCILLENNPELHGKVTIFGSSFYGLSSNDFIDKRYFDALSQLLIGANLVLMRDLYSANIVKQIAPSHVDTFGCDPAFLLEFPAKTPIISNGPIHFSFYRSGCNRDLSELVQDFGETHKKEVKEFHWLYNTGMQELKTKIELIRQSSLIITDTYHLAVTAMREGVPVICFGFGAQRIANTVSDKKKELLFAQHFMSQNYIFIEEVLKSVLDFNIRRGILETMYAVNQDLDSAKIAFRLLSNHTQRVREMMLTTFLEASR